MTQRTAVTLHLPPMDAKTPITRPATRWRAVWGLLCDYGRLSRPRIVAMVLFTMVVAAWTAGAEPPSWVAMAHALIGTAMVIVGAVALNQRLEFRGDAKMARTAGRPLPAGRMTDRHVTMFGLGITAVGVGYLAALTTPELVALAGLSWLIYVWTYTPLKSVTVWQTPIGAVAGAMPILLGAAVAEATFSRMAWVLFGILFFWQLPHAMAIAWLHRRQFADAEVRVATVVDPTGRIAGVMSVAGAFALLPVSWVPLVDSAAGWGYATAATILGAGYLACSIAFLVRRNDHTARRLLRASLVYLPIVLAALLW